MCSATRYLYRQNAVSNVRRAVQSMCCIHRLNSQLITDIYYSYGRKVCMLGGGRRERKEDSCVVCRHVYLHWLCK